MAGESGRKGKMFFEVSFFFVSVCERVLVVTVVVGEKCAQPLDVTVLHKVSTFYLSWQICHNNFALHCIKTFWGTNVSKMIQFCNANE